MGMSTRKETEGEGEKEGQRESKGGGENKRREKKREGRKERRGKRQREGDGREGKGLVHMSQDIRSPFFSISVKIIFMHNEVSC